MTEWTVLGRGPSLVRVTADDVPDPSRVIAINGAVYHRDPTCSHWLGIDQPGRYTLPDDRAPWGDGPPPVCITKASNIKHWQALWPACEYVVYNDGKNKVKESLPWKTAVDWMHWSVLLAMHYAAIHGKAKRIRVLGADMTGTAYAYTDKTVPIKANGHGPDRWRWDQERRDFAKACEELRKHLGIEVERLLPQLVGPKPEPSRSSASETTSYTTESEHGVKAKSDSLSTWPGNG